MHIIISGLVGLIAIASICCFVSGYFIKLNISKLNSSIELRKKKILRDRALTFERVGKLLDKNSISLSDDHRAELLNTIHNITKGYNTSVNMKELVLIEKIEELFPEIGCKDNTEIFNVLLRHVYLAHELEKIISTHESTIEKVRKDSILKSLFFNK
jgi:hypothetical protein